MPPATLAEAFRYYANPQTCIDSVAAMRWADGTIVCPRCQTAEGDRKHYWLNIQKRWKCFSCRTQFSVKVGTVLEDSPLPLGIWMVALWMLNNSGNGVNRREIADALAITQKSASFLIQRLRLLKDTGLD